MLISSTWYRLVSALLLCIPALRAYDLPLLNDGLTNILDGGPIRPTSGWYYYGLIQYYQNSIYTDSKGNFLENHPYIPSAEYFGLLEVVYQTERDVFLNAQGGLDVIFSFAFAEGIAKNNIVFQPENIALSTTGAGPGDVLLGLFLQWHPATWFNRFTFIHRLEFAASFPCGKYDPHAIANPGNGVYFLNPYWAATLYLTDHWALSWRLQYIWSAKNRFFNTQAGQAMILNYSMEYEIVKDFWASINGYVIGQYTDAQRNGQPVPDSREQAFAIGPGCLYTYRDNIFVFGHAYWETMAKNRPKGFNLVASITIHY